MWKRQELARGLAYKKGQMARSKGRDRLKKKKPPRQRLETSSSSKMYRKGRPCRD